MACHDVPALYLSGNIHILLKRAAIPVNRMLNASVLSFLIFNFSIASAFLASEHYRIISKHRCLIPVLSHLINRLIVGQHAVQMVILPQGSLRRTHARATTGTSLLLSLQ